MKGHGMLQFCFAIKTVSIKPGKPWFLLRFFCLDDLWRLDKPLADNMFVGKI